MEDCSYVSCIKINGVPILPPMITEDIKQEVSKYKANAISVEKKLAALRTANRNANIGKARNNLKDIRCRKRVDSSKENFVPFNYENGNPNDAPIETFENTNGNLDDESSMKQKFEDRMNLASRSESIDSSVNTDHSNETSSGKSTEIWKPQVPRTLDIVPLTLNDSNCKGSKEYHGDMVENTPKLTRQGSYVLETPSPILLAHMQMQVTGSSSSPPPPPPSRSEYVPTSQTTTTNRRKEWNVAQAKIDWEYEGKNKISDSTESFKSPTTTIDGSARSHVGHVMSKSLSLQTSSEPFVMYSSTKSADCIRTMLALENANKSCTHVGRNKKHTDNDDKGKQKRHMFNKCNSSSTVNTVSKLGGSLEDTVEDNKAVTEKLSKNVELPEPKSKSSIASDKLLIVYRKVQEMHKKQMAELMYRQQREQTLLQKEFEKQQLLLLTEIKRSFPEVSVSLLSENVLSPTLGQVSTGTEKLSENSDNSAEKSNNNLERNNEADYSQDNVKTVPCPVDYIYPEINCNSAPCSIKYSYNARSEMELPLNINYSPSKTGKGDAEQNSTKTAEVKLSEDSDQCKRSNVSRELFPLETVRVPILDGTIYGIKHIKAVNIINAYARGYLVRRLMRTERVIGLKNTYKEALHCMLKLHVDAPLNRSEFNLLHRLQLQCDAASMNLAELFAQSPQKRMQIIAQDREIKQSRAERPTSARSYSFATQRTLARKKLKEMEEYHPTSFVRPCLSSRSRCQTWTSDIKDRLISSHVLNHSIKRSTSAGTVRKPWR